MPNPLPNSLIHEEFGQLCLWSWEQFTGPILTHSTAWTFRATMSACSQHIPGCGIEQGCNFCFNKKRDKSQGLFCKLQRIIQWKNKWHFPREESGWDQGLHDLCQVLLCLLIAPGEQAWDVSKDMNIHWPWWHSPTNVHLLVCFCNSSAPSEHRHKLLMASHSPVSQDWHHLRYLY